MSDTPDNTEPTDLPESPAEDTPSPRTPPRQRMTAAMMLRQQQALAELAAEGYQPIGDSPDARASFALDRGNGKTTIKDRRAPHKVAMQMLYKVTGVKVAGKRYNCIFDATVQTLLEALGERDAVTQAPTDRAVKAATEFMRIACPVQRESRVTNNNTVVSPAMVDVTIEAMARVKLGIASGEVRDIFKANATASRGVHLNGGGGW